VDAYVKENFPTKLTKVYWGGSWRTFYIYDSGVVKEGDTVICSTDGFTCL
jgi:hypothetical protein